jgi:hypothetical protein
LVAHFATVRVMAGREGLPGPGGWLVLRYHVGTGELKTYLSNAPATTALALLGWVSGMRWPLETCFEDGKQYLGMGAYEVRSWRGWHQQMPLVILAHCCLVRLRLRFKKAPGLTLPQVQVLLLGVLPKPAFDSQLVLNLVGYWLRRNHAAYLSHRKQRITQLSQLSKVSL